MLLVHHDEAERLDRREHGRPRPDDHADRPAADLLPLVVALAVRQAAVLDRDALAEALPERAGQRRREANLGHQDQRGPARLADIARQPEVDLGLAAAGHAMKQRGSEPPLRGNATQCLVRRRLLGGQRPALSRFALGVGRQRGRVERIAVGGFTADGHQPATAQALQHVVRHAALAQLGDGEARRRARQERDRFALLGADELRSGRGVRASGRDLRDADRLERVRLPLQNIVHFDQPVGLERPHRRSRGQSPAAPARRHVLQPVRN